MPGSKVSIVIPVLNDVESLLSLLLELQPCREAGHEILVVDGGSADGSVTAARASADRVLLTGTGRGRQMNLGAENARHDILLFLHADSHLPDNALDRILEALDREHHHWGRFDIRLDGKGFIYSLIGVMMNLRSRVTGVATGDQGIFVRRISFHKAGGYEAIPIMEDVALSKALRKLSHPVCLSDKIVTSSRRWQQKGVYKTMALMWYLRLAYFLGADPARLAELYYPSAGSGNSFR